MKNKVWFGLLIAILCVASFMFIYGCGANPTSGGSSPSSSGVTYYGTQSPGDAWSWDIGSSTFTGKNLTKNWTISGTYVKLLSKFCKAEVKSSTTTEVIVGSFAYFLEIPNTMLLVKPGGDSNKVIVCVAAASSKPTEKYLNWVQIPWKTWNSANDTAYGTVEATYGDTTTFEVWFYKLNGLPPTTQATTKESGYTFADGKFQRGTEETQIFVSPSGVFGADQGEDNGGFAGAVALTTFTSTDVAGKNFRGVLFEYNSTAGTGETKPIGATGEANGVIHGADFDNIDLDTDPDYINKGATLEFGTFTNGVGSGTLTSGTGSYAFTLVVGKVGTPQKIMIFGISTQESGAYNFLVIEK